MRALRIVLLTAAAVVLVALAGCGGTQTRTVTVTNPGSVRNLGAVKAAVATGKVVPAGAIKVGPETARRPEGKQNPTEVPDPRLEGTTIAVFGPLPVESPALRGSEIRLDPTSAILIERFEEVQKSVYCPYWDAYGRVWTRGFGETDWGGNFGGRCISHATAVANLVYLVNTHYLPVIRGLGVNLTHHEIGALASFVWNLGPGIISGSIRADLGSYRFASAWSIMVQYVHAGGVTLAGLVTRRYAERSYFFTADPHACTGSCLRAQRLRTLHADEASLRSKRGRQATLRRVLVSDGCVRRRDHHEHLGERCTRWFREGAVIAKLEKHTIPTLRHQLGIR